MSRFYCVTTLRAVLTVLTQARTAQKIWLPVVPLLLSDVLSRLLPNDSRLDS
jgi:hypothetical protein